jgi:tRNA(Ile)-lysidine synthase
MLDKAWNFIKTNTLVEKGDRIVVGISGGADSVCLLYVLGKLSKEQELTLIAVHINHGIRGAEADRDEHFVKELCGRLGVEFHGYHYDVKKLSKEEGLSEEEAGRKVRYQAFLEICRERKCNKIAIAHNKNDNAETVLFHLFRGSGIKGLSGIEPKRVITTDFGDITLIRPLLIVERREIESFLNQEGIRYQTDSTNLTEKYSRNKIRRRILAYAVKEINLGAVSNIYEAATQLREIGEFVKHSIDTEYQTLVKQEKEGYRIHIKEMLTEPVVIQKGVIRLVLEKLAGKQKDLEAKHVEAVLALCGKQVGRYVHLPYNMIAFREYTDIRLYMESTSPEQIEEIDWKKTYHIDIPGRILLPGLNKILETEIISIKKDDPVPKSSCVKWFDYDKIENAVEIRTRREGDYIQINRFGGRKKIKDYFIDRKIPRNVRDSQILITDGSHVMWIPGDGERMSEKYKVDETTANVLLMRLCDLEEKEDDRKSKSHDTGGTGKREN